MLGAGRRDSQLIGGIPVRQQYFPVWAKKFAVRPGKISGIGDNGNWPPTD
jgi:hypothetical protein